MSNEPMRSVDLAFGSAVLVILSLTAILAIGWIVVHVV